MFKTDTSLAEFDPEISAAIESERTRQEQHIELIASENHTILSPSENHTFRDGSSGLSPDQ